MDFKKIFFFIFFILLGFFLSFSQNNFSIINNKNKDSFKFKFINNLIIIPITLNRQKLNFILDSGVKQSLLFNVTASDSLDLKQVKRTTIKGLGEGENYIALESKNNLLRINNIVSTDFSLLVILDEKFDFSQRMGIDIHGIIGSNLFKNFIIEVNYSRKRISFYNPKTYIYKKCKKCETLPLTFHYQKPYIDGLINTFDNKEFPLKLLIDSGSGDSLWLFINSLDNYKVPPKNVDVLLGRGLSGNIFGKKSKLTSFTIGSFKFNELIIAHPDSSSVIGNNVLFKRNGIIGAEILKRFHVIYDYPSRKITLKKNKRFFKTPFSYNKSGIELKHHGRILLKEQKSKVVFNKNSYDDIYKTLSTFNYSFKNVYQISFIKPNSIAEKAGLKKNDIISKVNGKFAYNYTLQQIMHKFSAKTGNKIKLKVTRNGMFYTFEFVLKEML